MNRKQLKSLCRRILACDTLDQAIEVIERAAKRLPEKGKRGTWGYWFCRFVESLKSGQVPHSIFAEDNSKLPFYAFSTLPEFTCPGAGACLEWCYSFRAWRYPAAFLRQLQNTLLLKFRPDVIADAFKSLPNGITFRLYVDGDFESVERVAFWFGLLAERSDIEAYGYSKSWVQILEYGLNGGQYPANYKLNLSSGSKWESNSSYFDAMAALPITRGQFVAVSIDGTGLPKGFAKYSLTEYHSRVREQLKKAYPEAKTMSCPGLCGSCTKQGHACGGLNGKADTLVIGIGIH